jgi:adenylate kinase
MIVFMGVAGSGKSMQGRMLADRLALSWLSTGEFLRMLISGDERRDMIAGKLLDDEEIIGLVQKIFTIVDVEEEFVMDGFPRTFGQADWLLNQAKYGQLNITGVVHLLASEEAVLARLLGRGRQDDNQEAIRERFREYEEAIKPILAQFKQAGISIHEINGEQEPEPIHIDIMKALGRA